MLYVTLLLVSFENEPRRPFRTLLVGFDEVLEFSVPTGVQVVVFGNCLPVTDTIHFTPSIDIPSRASSTRSYQMVLLPSTALGQISLILVFKWELMCLSLRTTQLPREHV